MMELQLGGTAGISVASVMGMHIVLVLEGHYTSNTLDKVPIQLAGFSGSSITPAQALSYFLVSILLGNCCAS